MSTLEDRRRALRVATARRKRRIVAIAVASCAAIVLASEFFMEFGIASRLILTEAEMAERHLDRVMMTYVTITHFAIACPMPGINDDDLKRFNAYADAHNWNHYPQGGLNCRDP